MTAKEFSRPAAVAAALGDDSQRFMAKRVLLTGEAALLLSQNGHETFRASFLLLVRICQNVIVALPDTCEMLRADINSLAAQIVPGRQIEISLVCEQASRDFDAVLSIGTKGRADLPWTVINSDGWLARLSSRGGSLPAPTASENAIAAIAAACLGVGEVYKRLIQLKSRRGELLDVTSFSLWNYGLSQDSGPVLQQFDIDCLLIGCGAIGSGVAYILSRSPVSGRALPLDPQNYAEENFGTSIAIGPGDYTQPKAVVLSKLLQPKLNSKPIDSDIAGFAESYDGSFPDVILTALDSVDPRHQAQQLWPGMVIDGAVGSELSCQVSCHPWESDIACLKCMFQKPPATNLAELNARATGLPRAVANDPATIITEEVIASVPEDRKNWLRQHLGKRICSITAEAAVKFLSDATHPEGFAPAVPFVSCFSACMMVTELVRFVTTGAGTPAPRYQMNFLWGPRRGVPFEEARRDDCICVERRLNISRWRKQRTTSQPGGE